MGRMHSRTRNTNHQRARKTEGILHQKLWQTCMIWWNYSFINIGKGTTHHEHIKGPEKLFVTYTVLRMILAPWCSMSLWYTIDTLRHNTHLGTCFNKQCSRFTTYLWMLTRALPVLHHAGLTSASVAVWGLFRRPGEFGCEGEAEKIEAEKVPEVLCFWATSPFVLVNTCQSLWTWEGLFQMLSPTKRNTGWWFGTFVFPFRLGTIVPGDKLIFFRGVGFNHQQDNKSGQSM